MIGRRRGFAALLAVTLMVGGTVSAAAATSARSAPATQTVAALRQATNQFHNLTRAENAGYELFTDDQGIACIDMPGMGGMGVHFVDSAFVGDASEHALHPEALVYRIDATGKLRLSAVEYVVIAAAWDATHSAPPELYGQTFSLTPVGNRYGLPAYYSLHVWAWYHNPAGTFAPYNPRVQC
jgi:hypothetical protein